MHVGSNAFRYNLQSYGRVDNLKVNFANRCQYHHSFTLPMVTSQKDERLLGRYFSSFFSQQFFFFFSPSCKSSFFFPLSFQEFGMSAWPSMDEGCFFFRCVWPF